MNSFDHELIFKYELKQIMIKHRISFTTAINLVKELKHEDRNWTEVSNNSDYFNENLSLESSLEDCHS